jgi:hypothetical protein
MSDGQQRPPRRSKSATWDSGTLARISALDLDGLRAEWRRVTGTPAPACLKRDLLLRALAFRLQVNTFGDVSKTTAKLLDKLATARDPRAVLRALKPRRIKPGCQLVREHQGVLHRVTVLQDGFSWNGQVYESLSGIARAITGTNWNGPRFFGLREPEAEPQTAEQPDTGRRAGKVGRR